MNRGQVSGPVIPVVQVVVVALVLVTVGTVMDAAADQQELERHFEEARAYCDQVYGSPEIYTAMVVGQHGGTHCEANARENAGHPHLHQIPQSQLQAAWRAEQGLPHESILPPEDVAEPMPYGGFGIYVSLFPVALGLALLIGAVPFVWRWLREDETPG